MPVCQFFCLSVSAAVLTPQAGASRREPGPKDPSLGIFLVLLSLRSLWKHSLLSAPPPPSYTSGSNLHPGSKFSKRSGGRWGVRVGVGKRVVGDQEHLKSATCFSFTINKNCDIQHFKNMDAYSEGKS